jgi:hypothetical protein
MTIRAAVTQDTTTREITIELAGVPDLDVTQSWHSKPRIIRPSLARIRIVDHQTRHIAVKGGLVLKSGKASTEVTDSAGWRADGYLAREQIGTAPEWVQMLWREAPVGVTTWRLDVAA